MILFKRRSLKGFRLIFNNKEENMKNKLKEIMPVIAGLIVILILIIIPTGFEGAQIFKGTERVPAKVLSTDNSQIVDNGLIRTGEQSCSVEVLKGKFKGEVIGSAVNMLTGSYENDKIFTEGDKALIIISYRDSEILSAAMIDHYRLNYEIILAVIFGALLIITAGKTGFRSLLSFIITILAVWKAVVPLYLKGIDPIVSGAVFITLLSVIIIAMVYGFDRRCFAATAGVMSGVMVALVFGAVFTNVFKIHGAVMSMSESLLYCGYGSLNLTSIFTASIFIGSSGAMMDLAVDITSAMYEITQKKPDITAKELIISGMNIGRAAMGTISTTLLLAYTGSCIAMLMVFMAQGTPLVNILNYKYVAAEIVHTVAGSIGLTAVAPLTAVLGGTVLTYGTKAAKE